jgi:hypothetical protein
MSSTATRTPIWVTRLLGHWQSAENALAIAAYGLVCLMLISDVLGRELLGPALRLLGVGGGATGVFGSQKVALYAMVLGSFLGLGIATATGSHLLPKVGFGWLPSAWGPTVDRVADVLTGLTLCTAAWYGWKFVVASRDSGMLAAVFDLPLWMIQVVLPLGFVSAGLRYFFYACWPGTRPALPEFQE